MDYFVGDNATTEFFLSKTIARPEDVMVFVGGALQRPDEPGTAHDFALRGHTSGYAGDKNAVKFTAAPGTSVDVQVWILST